MNFFKKLFGGQKKEEPKQKQDFTEEDFQRDYEEKLLGLEAILGKMSDIVGHAIIPFSVGGAVDMYYFPNHIEGTGFATMELLDPSGNGPLPNRLGTYELVAFTKEAYNKDRDNESSFALIEGRIWKIFTTIGNYSFQAKLNPNETCELPGQNESNYLVFDNYQPNGKDFLIGKRKHHLLLCLEVFKSEMEFARNNGSDVLFSRLKATGHYPYSDLNREPVA